MNEEISSEQLRRLAATYMAAAEKLIAAADVLDGLCQPKKLEPGEPKERVPDDSGQFRQQPRRREQLQFFLERHGPSSRKRIIAESHIPTGTLATILKKKYGFLQDLQGRWYYRKPEGDGAKSGEDNE
jgi:hypothetical protein